MLYTHLIKLICQHITLATISSKKRPDTLPPNFFLQETSHIRTLEVSMATEK